MLVPLTVANVLLRVVSARVLVPAVTVAAAYHPEGSHRGILWAGGPLTIEVLKLLAIERTAIGVPGLSAEGLSDIGILPLLVTHVVAAAAVRSEVDSLQDGACGAGHHVLAVEVLQPIASGGCAAPRQRVGHREIASLGVGQGHGLDLGERGHGALVGGLGVEHADHVVRLLPGRGVGGLGLGVGVGDGLLDGHLGRALALPHEHRGLFLGGGHTLGSGLVL